MHFYAFMTEYAFICILRRNMHLHAFIYAYAFIRTLLIRETREYLDYRVYFVSTRYGQEPSSGEVDEGPWPQRVQKK